MKRLAEAAAAAAGTISAAVHHPEHSQVTSASEVQSPADKQATMRETTPYSKRKRAEKKQPQPLKGGWTLPHGMGVKAAEQDVEAPTTAVSMSLVSTPSSVSAVESGFSQGSTAASQTPNTDKTVSKQRKQTRLFSRTTKAGVSNGDSDSKEQSKTAKLEETERVSINEESAHPAKRARITRSAAGMPSFPASISRTLAVTEVQAEGEILPSPSHPKLLIIQGIVFNDGVVAKVMDKITVDAAQILDPNFRLTLKRGKENPYGLTPGFSPYPYRRVPTPEACEEVHRILTELHGEVKQPERMPAASLEVAGCGEVPCVLDALLRTLISGNTLMAMADAAIRNLVQHYGLRKRGTGAGSIDWEKVRLSSEQELAQVIRVSGNGPRKSHHIKLIIDMVFAENLQRGQEQASGSVTDAKQTMDGAVLVTSELLSLDHMHNMSKDEAIAKFVCYPGIGIKTAACVTLFCLRKPCFAVDTHVHKFCRWLGWIPEKADPDNCFRHGEVMVPDHLKYGLHQLFIRHGQQCFKCRKATKPGTKDWDEAAECPLEHLLDRSKNEAGAKPKGKKVKQEESSDTEGPDIDVDTEAEVVD